VGVDEGAETGRVRVQEGELQHVRRQHESVRTGKSGRFGPVLQLVSFIIYLYLLYLYWSYNLLVVPCF